MTIAVAKFTQPVSDHMIVQTVRNARCETSIRKQPAKKRTGIYGPTLEAAKRRIAKKLNTTIEKISWRIDSLMRRGKLHFSKKRLAAAKRGRSINKNTSVSCKQAVEIITKPLDPATPSEYEYQLDNHTIEAWSEFFVEEENRRTASMMQHPSFTD